MSSTITRAVCSPSSARESARRSALMLCMGDLVDRLGPAQWRGEVAVRDGGAHGQGDLG